MSDERNSIRTKLQAILAAFCERQDRSPGSRVVAPTMQIAQGHGGSPGAKVASVEDLVDAAHVTLKPAGW
jgi:hypothetical protein